MTIRGRIGAGFRRLYSGTRELGPITRGAIATGITATAVGIAYATNLESVISEDLLNLPTLPADSTPPVDPDEPWYTKATGFVSQMIHSRTLWPEIGITAGVLGMGSARVNAGAALWTGYFALAARAAIRSTFPGASEHMEFVNEPLLYSMAAALPAYFIGSAVFGPIMTRRRDMVGYRREEAPIEPHGH